MKHVTLAKLLETQTHHHILTLKQTLLFWKRQGVIFFQKEVADLSMSQEFALYYYLAKGNNPDFNAFPVPTSLVAHASTKRGAQQLTNYFQSYYDTNQTLFEDEMTLHKYVGLDYSWFYSVPNDGG
ncbi:hypothetical protein [Salibacterium qingdaonense]|uniref:Uncharacterized protein n=1 Tax=Salibacterium qingdaonense TaxID=266892 RepID=A0A1I4NKD7_9BACI|nr:hypothetical protein [Salibacterium qingdaonense]SFM15633.1 hypothetical protein SAMN04488054_11850 [Salibacterium qingdaonense]